MNSLSDRPSGFVNILYQGNSQKKAKINWLKMDTAKMRTGLRMKVR